MNPLAQLERFGLDGRRVLQAGIGAPLLVLAMLMMVVIPLPPLALDVFFTFNITLSLVVMLATIYAARPLEFAVFPTVLLVATLLRLALNVASTRVVLLEGHTGTDAAGHVIEAFGSFVIGGNYAVGIVVFAILVIINFVVVTKGAGRISEVSARFTLDAMPGKQMAIDADLNAGVLDQETAAERRLEIAREADFYGSMDGASKFVRGDAIAGILILLINIVGGLAIGTGQHDMAFAQAVENYVLLTIGDGLVAQIPSLLLSSAAAVIVTRMSTAEDLGERVLGQLFGNPRVLTVSAAVMGLLGVLPGMPNVAFLTLAAACGAGAWMMTRREGAREEGEEPGEEEAAVAPEQRDVGWDDVEALDPLALEVGYRLIPLVDVEQNGELLARIRSVRRKRTRELGFLVPPVHIRDALDLEPGRYRIKVMGVIVGEGEIEPGLELAIDASGEAGARAADLPGQPTRDPVFGLEARWIEPALRGRAQALGFMVFDPATVITTHMDKVVTDYAHELFGPPDAQLLLDRLAERSPKLLEGLIPDRLSLGTVTRVMQNLLREGIPLLNLPTIVETLAEHARHSQDPDVLTAQVRIALGRYIVQSINGLRPELAVVVLDPNLDQLLQRSLQAGSEGGAGLDAETLSRLEQGVAEAARIAAESQDPVVLLVADGLRPILSQLARRVDPELRVLAISELPDNQRVRSIARVGGPEAAGGTPGIPGGIPAGGPGPVAPGTGLPAGLPA